MALVLAAASLALNAALLSRLRQPERWAGPAADRVLRRLAEQDARIKYQIRIPAGTPVSFDVPIDEAYTVKLRTSLPIDTQIRVPVRGPLGTANVRVPVKTTIPIRQDIPVQVRDTFRLRTATRTEYVVPLELRVRDLPLDAISQSLSP